MVLEELFQALLVERFSPEHSSFVIAWKSRFNDDDLSTYERRRKLITDPREHDIHRVIHKPTAAAT